MSMIGKTLGNFQITSQIGKGGMGEVYQAKDQKLGRDVAIKVLPEEFAKDADRVARFQREAKLLASLNHRNIAAIYGLEESTGTHFLVMELIEGDTLADQIKRGPIPVEESLKLALQIAEALEAAHEKGVIHRDLKPANIKVTPDGKVKVLDFGLAKAFAGEQADLNLSNSPTLSDMATQQGVILGTAAYMSPEQAKGKSVDKRSDIWAFGAVLFEMLTGKPAFPGEDVSEILASVIKGDSNLELLPPNIHPRMREVLTRCLQKDQKKRYSNVGEAEYEIERVLSDPVGVFVAPATAAEQRLKVRQIIPRIAAVAILAAIITGYAVWILKPAPQAEPRSITRFEIELPEGQQFTDLELRPNLAISPDGKRLVYATPQGLYLRYLDQLTANLITGTEGPAEQPFFSPDGKWIGYYADQRLKKIAIGGGAPETICPVTKPYMIGASWNADNTIIYGQYPGDIMQVSADGGTPVSIVKTKSAGTARPSLLPDGKSVLYTDSPGPNQTTVMVYSMGSDKPKELFTGVVVGYFPTGHIVYGLQNDNNLYAIRFDLDTLEPKGIPVRIVEGVTGHAGAQSAVSDSGTLVYVTGTSSSLKFNRRAFVWVDRMGKEEPFAAEPDDYGDRFKISPDGTRVALSIFMDENYDVYVWEIDRENKIRLTQDDSVDISPIWTPDGQQIIFESFREGRESIYLKAADGSEKIEELTSLPNRDIWPVSVSSDGKTLLLGGISGESGYDIGILSMEGDRAPKWVLQEKYNEIRPQISPDGKWMAYQSDQSSRWEIYVCPFPPVVNSKRWLVSKAGGESPLWSPYGKELFYRSPDAIMAVSVKTEPAFKPGLPISLFPDKYVGQFDISPDGKRFLMLKPEDEESETEAPRKIVVVLNWFEDLKDRVPVE